MMILFIGTRAQLIKMAPVMLEMEQRGMPYLFILSGQHKKTLTEIISDFGITTKPVYLYEGNEVDAVHQVPWWYIMCIVNFLKLRRNGTINLQQAANVMLIHGDTFSTLLGATIAKLIRAKVFHIEAGLRSGNIFHPFPEELTRIITFHMSDVSFCPGDFAYNNMLNYRSIRINTVENTLLDSTRYALQKNRPTGQDTFGYGVCSIHRFENIFFRKKLEHIVRMLELVSARINIKFVLHPATRKRLVKYKLLEKLENNASIELLDRMNYTDFIRLLSGSAFVITDGGSNQEELSYLGKPTLLMRKHTERIEGLTSTAVLSNYDEATIRKFAADYTRYRQDNPPILQQFSPSSVIVDYLQGV
jgi:UDP-N-acetylglucosamine 2-epimerase (non-hydrolysing)